MIKVIKINDKYQVKYGSALIDTTTLKNTIAALRTYNVEYNEIEYGLIELNKKGNGIAEYGVGLSDGHPKFIFAMSIMQ